jgi:nitroreductase
MMLKITDLGLGSCWVGSFSPEKISELLNLEENIIPVALLPFGYISEDSKPSQEHLNRKTIDKFVKDIK